MTVLKQERPTNKGNIIGAIVVASFTGACVAPGYADYGATPGYVPIYTPGVPGYGWNGGWFGGGPRRDGRPERYDPRGGGGGAGRAVGSRPAPQANFHKHP